MLYSPLSWALLFFMALRRLLLHDARHVLLGDPAGIEKRARLQRGEADGVRPQRAGCSRDRSCSVSTFGQVALRAFAEAVPQRGIRVTRLDFQPGFVKRPGPHPSRRGIRRIGVRRQARRARLTKANAEPPR